MWYLNSDAIMAFRVDVLRIRMLRHPDDAMAQEQLCDEIARLETLEHIDLPTCLAVGMALLALRGLSFGREGAHAA